MDTQSRKLNKFDDWLFDKSKLRSQYGMPSQGQFTKRRSLDIINLDPKKDIRQVHSNPEYDRYF